MSKKLSLIPMAWESIRSLAERGQRIAALEQLTAFLSRLDVPVSIAVDAHRLAAELAIGAQRFATARRHLQVAIALDATHANTHYLAGIAWEEDPDGCDRRAAICFRRAEKLDSANAVYRAAFGRAAARCGKLKLGVREMLIAATQTPHDIRVVRVAVQGLLEVGKPAKARKIVTLAKFACPQNRELETLWQQTQFELARVAQKKSRQGAKNTRFAQDARFAMDGDRVLPFIRIADSEDDESPKPKSVRTDTISFPRPHWRHGVLGS